MQATVPGGFKIATKTYPLSEVESVWDAETAPARVVFQIS